METPPTMPRAGLKVFSAAASPPGTETVIRRPPPQPSSPHTANTASRIICRGTRLMAASPTGWSRPGLVTRPTPWPPSMETPGRSCRSAWAKTSSPVVASMSSPPSLRTAQEARPPERTQDSRGASTVSPLGVSRETEGGGVPVSSSRTAPAAARAAQVPVV